MLILEDVGIVVVVADFYLGWSRDLGLILGGISRESGATIQFYSVRNLLNESNNASSERFLI